MPKVSLISEPRVDDDNLTSLMNSMFYTVTKHIMSLIKTGSCGYAIVSLSADRGVASASTAVFLRSPSLSHLPLPCSDPELPLSRCPVLIRSQCAILNAPYPDYHPRRSLCGCGCCDLQSKLASIALFDLELKPLTNDGKPSFSVSGYTYDPGFSPSSSSLSSPPPFSPRCSSAAP